MTPNEKTLIEAIERMFEFLGSGCDPTRVAGIFCQDFHAFENGVRMTADELFTFMRTAYAQGRRYKWSVTQHHIELQGDLGLVVYVNQGEISEGPGAAAVPASWLETVHLRRDQAVWRIAFIHATRAKPAS